MFQVMEDGGYKIIAYICFCLQKKVVFQVMEDGGYKILANI